MKKHILRLNVLVVLGFIFGFSFTPRTAWAGPQLFSPVSTCTTTNCSAATYRGTYETFSFLRTFDSQPFILQVFALANECLRLDVTSQQTDLEMVLISPNGTFWRNDDATPGSNLRPRIKAITNVKGWYTLQISSFSGLGPAGGSDFTLKYGRYNSGNPNCSGATTPSLDSQSDQKP